MISSRLPFNLRWTVLHHPFSALREGLALSFIDDSLSRFTKAPAGLLRQWRHELVHKTRLHEEILTRVRRFGLDKIDGFSLGGTIGPYNETLYLLIRSLAPRWVVETGVASGFSTSYILQALKDSGGGHLHSIDLPNTDPKGFVDREGHRDAVYVPSRSLVGAVVPDRLRSYWTLHVGRSDSLLQGVLESLGEVDVFHHDSDHSYTNMLWEFRSAWPCLRENGLLISDDIRRHRAFEEFRGTVDAPEFRWLGSQGRMGALRKVGNPVAPGSVEPLLSTAGPHARTSPVRGSGS